MIVFGARTRITDLGTVGFYPCPNCHNHAPFRLHHRRVWFTLFWVPIFPYQSDFFLACDVCSRGAVLTRPQAQQLLHDTALAVHGASVAQVTGEPSTSFTSTANAGSNSPPPGAVPRLPPTVPRAVWIGGAVVIGLIILVAVIGSNGNSRVNGSTPPDPEITSHNEQFTGPTTAEAKGTVKNNGGDTVRSLVINFYVVDNGQRVANGQQSLGDISPGASADYDIQVTVPASVTNAIADVEWNWQAAQCPNGTVASPDPSGNGNYCISLLPSLSPS